MPRWILYQCPANESVTLETNVAHVAGLLLSQLFGGQVNTSVVSCWYWCGEQDIATEGAGPGDGRRRLHVAQGDVLLPVECASTESLVVVPRDGGNACGIVVLGSLGRLACIHRQLWVASASEFPFGASRLVETRGANLQECWKDAKSAGAVTSSVASLLIILLVSVL